MTPQELFKLMMADHQVYVDRIGGPVIVKISKVGLKSSTLVNPKPTLMTVANELIKPLAVMKVKKRKAS